MNGKKLIAGVVALVLVIAVAYAAYKELSGNFEPTQIQDAEPSSTPGMAPDFTVYDAGGEAHKLSDFRGKPVVINFWATWCGWCKVEMPDFEAAAKEHAGDVEFLMVNVGESTETGEAFIDENGYTFPVYYDEGMDAALAYGASSLPMTVFVDAEGRLSAYSRGALTAETLQQGIDMIL